MVRQGFKLAAYDPKARTFALGQSSKIQGQIRDKLLLLEGDPYYPGSKQLEGVDMRHQATGLPIRRFRSGNFRILYCVDGSTREITIVDIGFRKNVYGDH